MQKESLLEILKKSALDPNRLWRETQLLNAKYEKSESFEVVVARFEDYYYEDEGASLSSYYDYLTIYFRCQRGKKIWKHQLDRIQTKGNYDKDRFLREYNKAKVEILKYDVILAGWADEKGNWGPNYLINLEKLHKEMLVDSLADKLSVQGDNYCIKNRLFE